MKIVELKKPTPGNVIRVLEELLEEAKAGEVVALAYVGVRPNNNTVLGSVWEPGSTAPLLLSGTVFLQDKLKTEILEG